MSASWLQLVLAIAVMYTVVAAAGYWGKRKRAQQGAQHHDKGNNRTRSPHRRTE